MCAILHISMICHILIHVLNPLYWHTYLLSKESSSSAMAIENFKRIIDSAVNADIFDQEDSFEEEEEKFHLRGSDADGVESSGSGTCSSAYPKGCSDIGGKCGAKTGCYDDGPERGACRGTFKWTCQCVGEGGNCYDEWVGQNGQNKACCNTNANGEQLYCFYYDVTDEHFCMTGK